jgi:hypothetical protein
MTNNEILINKKIKKISSNLNISRKDAKKIVKISNNKIFTKNIGIDDIFEEKVTEIIEDKMTNIIEETFE